MRYLAIDHGAKRIGLAVSDAGESMAFPLCVFQADSSVFLKIARVVKEEKIQAVVVGLPLNMDGTEGQSAKSARVFSRQLEKIIGFPVVFYDERLSSFDADNKISGMELSRKKKKERQDAVAAASFLQAFLDDRKQPAKHHQDGPEIIVLENSTEAACRALEIFTASAKYSIEKNGKFCCAISGGSSPAEFFRRLSESEQLDWSKIHVFWADERCVEQNHPDSNYHLASETFLKKVPLPSENIHAVPVFLKEPQKAAEEYEQIIRHVLAVNLNQMPVFDLIILGLGSDGHTASLLPQTDILKNQKDIAAVVSSENTPYVRISLTQNVLVNAKNLLFIITGYAKKEIIHLVLSENPESGKYPVYLLWPAGKKMIWLLDKAAAEKISY